MWWFLNYLPRHATPVTYIDKNDSPFLIMQGGKDESVPHTQSRLSSSWPTIAHVKDQLIIVPGALTYDEMFDAENIRKSVFNFLALYEK
ncbi:MAG TPA: hypothetical protein VF540_04815 [Segetibacter sp.]